MATARRHSVTTLAARGLSSAVDARFDFARSLAPRLLAHLEESSAHDYGANGAPPTIALRSPAELRAAFRAAGTDLEHLGATAARDALERACDVVLECSARTGSAGFNNQLYGGVDADGLAAEWLATSCNTNAHSFEVAPVFTLVERAVIAKLNRVVRRCSGGTDDDALGGDADEDDALGEGLMVPGGSMANVYAVHLARDAATAGAARARGNHAGADGRQLVMLTSSESHYSYQKAASRRALRFNVRPVADVHHFISLHTPRCINV